MNHEDNPEHETMTESHILHDRLPVHMDMDKVKDDSENKNYKPTWNRGKFQHKADM